MKILIVHNHYQRGPSGETTVFFAEKELLEKKGHKIITYERFNDEINSMRFINKVSLIWQTSWSWKTYNEIKTLIIKEKPDLAHFHNTLPLISPSSYYACKELGIPVVQTVHNYRIFCANGLFIRNKKICMHCLNGTKLYAVIKRCYRRSLIQTAAVVAMQTFHDIKKTWLDKIDRYIILSNFSKNVFIKAGLPNEKIRVKPNFTLSKVRPTWKDLGYAVFVGNLSPYKGVLTMLKAWKEIKDIPLIMVGDGPMKHEINEYIKVQKLNNVELKGYLPWSDTMQIIKNSSFLVMPSEWHEIFGCVIIEAYSLGKPVVASDIEPINEIVKDGKTGLLFKVACERDLVNKVKMISENVSIREQLGRMAYEEYKKNYTEENNYARLINIYREIL